jgi:hypothetical protein
LFVCWPSDWFLLRTNPVLPNHLFCREAPEEALTTTNFAPPVDIYEDEHTITLKLDVPGIAEKDIDVRIEALNTEIAGGEQYGIRTVWLCGRPYRSADETLSPKDVRPTYTIRAFRQLPLLLQRIRDTRFICESFVGR